ncbi:hypothetical protein IAQ61_007643 [Plenodomus lingam]|uniref:Similar to female reproductive tract protease GLEANR_897 n=1 Tax=Leptosphaeria maculans (strain JN3 / isolate v23.1.3 / race Av1-4-5-6-7-8) TaxID=985895 RepID=E5A535_LEPMJ|nr:similar to female reproductive tract protease GLEANR_897 [Plenodomus lingam JN3]KAH9867052.1 hypothetical protein IAQ61_007643 [Plenodomus lingam]CBX98733.1 similar to female reproductive tract protease GLEANR_897 [Plenodomus lingam JN3]
MQLKKVLITLAVPAICIAAAIPTPQDPVEPDFPEEQAEDIVGGVAARAGDVPYIVSVALNGQHWCGGSLLNANTVVTAAHCIEEGATAADYSIRAGSLDRRSGGVVSQVTRLIPHPEYNTGLTDNDAAIFKLATPVQTSSSITYATLAPAGNDPAPGSTLTVAGWGDDGNGNAPVRLQKVDVPIVDRDTCRSNYPRNPVSENMFCAGFTQGGRDSCQGDSGGPIFDTAKTLIGLVSWGGGCALPNKPGVYARVGTVGAFIRANM